LCALKIGRHLGLGCAQEGETTVNFGDDAFLLGGWRQRDRNSPAKLKR
jgi:hypothetical protein